MSEQPPLFADLYRQPSPRVVASECSREARVSVQPHLTDLHRRVLEALATPQTAEELEASTGLAGNCLRPRLIELAALAKVRRNGERRPTRSGRLAAVWERYP